MNSLHHFDPESGRVRNKRSDSATNIFEVLKIMVKNMDMDTLSWGMWFIKHDGTSDFYTRGEKHLSDMLGVCTKTIQRIMSDLEDAGYLKSQRMSGLGKDGNLTKHYSLRTFSEKFFIELGFQRQTIYEARSWKRKSNEIKFYKKASKSCKIGLKRIGDTLKHFSNKAPMDRKEAPKTKSGEKRFIDKAFAIAEKTCRSPMDVLRELKLQI